MRQNFNHCSPSYLEHILARLNDSLSINFIFILLIIQAHMEIWINLIFVVTDIWKCSNFGMIVGVNVDWNIVLDPCLQKTEFLKKVRKDKTEPNNRSRKLFHCRGESDKSSQAFNIRKKDDSVKFIYTTSDEIIVCKIYPYFASLLEGNIEIFLNGSSFTNFLFIYTKIRKIFETFIKYPYCVVAYLN